MNYISLNIKYLRKLKKITQLTLANEIGTKRQNITTWEDGRANPSVDNIVKIAHYFDVKIDDFINKNLSEYENSEKNDLIFEEKREEFQKNNNSFVDYLQEEIKRMQTQIDIKDEIIRELIKKIK